LTRKSRHKASDYPDLLTQTCSGVDVYHPDLRGRAYAAFNALKSGTDKDESGHGTGVAGLLVGEQYGIAKGARVASVKVLDGQGHGTLTSLLRGLEFVYEDFMTLPKQRAVIK
jgi:subtilisin family serine protease